jgi:hypothetical protein
MSLNGIMMHAKSWWDCKYPGCSKSYSSITYMNKHTRTVHVLAPLLHTTLHWVVANKEVVRWVVMLDRVVANREVKVAKVVRRVGMD